jgi:hypothetical protein
VARGATGSRGAPGSLGDLRLESELAEPLYREVELRRFTPWASLGGLPRSSLLLLSHEHDARGDCHCPDQADRKFSNGTLPSFQSTSTSFPEWLAGTMPQASAGVLPQFNRPRTTMYGPRGSWFHQRGFEYSKEAPQESVGIGSGAYRYLPWCETRGAGRWIDRASA